MIIRKPKLSEVERLSELYLQFYSAHNFMGKFWFPKWAPKNVKTYKDFLNSNETKKNLKKDAIDAMTKWKNTYLFVADIDGEIAGYISFYIKKNPNDWYSIKKWGVIDDTCVDTKFRKKGIARKLLVFAENFLKKKGIKYVLLDTRPLNEVAQKTWEALGYKKEVITNMKELK